MRGEAIKRHDVAKHRYEFLAMRVWQVSDNFARIDDQESAAEVLEKLSGALVDSGLLKIKRSTASARYDCARADWNETAMEFYRMVRSIEKFGDLDFTAELNEKASAALEDTGIIPHVSD